MTLAEMLARMSSTELSWWSALYRVEDEERLADAAAAEAARPPNPD